MRRVHSASKAECNRATEAEDAVTEVIIQTQYTVRVGEDFFTDATTVHDLGICTDCDASMKMMSRKLSRTGYTAR